MVFCRDLQQLLDDQLGTVEDNDIQDGSLELVYSNSVVFVDLSVVVEVGVQVVVRKAVVKIYRLVGTFLAIVTVEVPGLMAFVSASLGTSSV
jgi:Na+-translocating ferredoxin:NAD+ oxidoreductase RnfA subunit